MAEKQAPPTNAANNVIEQLAQTIRRAAQPELPPDDFETVPQSEWVNVTVPAEGPYGDPLDFKFRNGKHEFEPGKTYFMPPAFAADLQDRIKAYNKSEIRRLQPRKNLEALAAVDRPGVAVPING